MVDLYEEIPLHQLTDALYSCDIPQNVVNEFMHRFCDDKNGLTVVDLLKYLAQHLEHDMFKG